MAKSTKKFKKRLDWVWKYFLAQECLHESRACGYNGYISLGIEFILKIVELLELIYLSYFEKYCFTLNNMKSILIKNVSIPIIQNYL